MLLAITEQARHLYAYALENRYEVKIILLYILQYKEPNNLRNARGSESFGSDW